MGKQTTLRQFLARFPDDDACLDHIFNSRFGEATKCPGCSQRAVFYRVAGRRSYACGECGYHIYPTAGTFLHRTRLGLHSWFMAIFLFCSSRNGVAAKELERQIGVTYKTAWRMARIIREHMADVDEVIKLGGPGRPMVEIDEGFIGPKNRPKSTIVAMAERRGELKTTPVDGDRPGSQAQKAIVDTVRPGARIATDKGSFYKSLSDYGYRHGTVNHGRKQWRKGDAYTNNVEAFWMLLKRGIKGTYVSISTKYAPLYVSEFQFRWNLRKSPEQMLPALLGVY